MDIKLRSLAAFKRLVRPGTVLVCVHNTYRPELNGTTRTVLTAQTNGYYWTTEQSAKDKRSFSDYPKASDVTLVGGDTIEWKMSDEGHRLMMRVVSVGPEVVKVPKAEKAKPLAGDEVTFAESGPAFGHAKHKAKYAHRAHLVWKDTAGVWHAAKLVKEVMRKVIADHAIGETGKPCVTKVDGSPPHFSKVGRQMMEAMLSNLENGVRLD